MPKHLKFDVSNEITKAVHYHRSGELEKAERIYKKILTINPHHSDAFYLLGLMAHQTGKYDEALRLISRAIQNNPKNPLYHNDLGIVFQSQGKLDKAISSFQKAMELSPNLAIAYNNLANALKEQGRLDEAISYYQKALRLKPDMAEPYLNMGNALKEQGRLNEALPCYQNALRLRPNSAETYINTGYVFRIQGRLNEALSCYQKALQLEPDRAEPYIEMGLAFQSQGRSDEAIASFRKALEVEPRCADAYSHLSLELQLTCSWKELENLTAILDELTKEALDNGKVPAESPFLNIMRNDDPSRNFVITQSWSSNIDRTMSRVKTHFSFDAKKREKTRITVGYLSGNFNNHPVAHLILGLFGLHNRDEFEIFCYSYGRDDKSHYRTQIQKDCDKFVDLCNLGFADAAKCIYEDHVDILVDLMGHTKNNRLSICALRPAPIQVSYLGFPGTTGANFFDYIITDRIVTPEDHAPYYSERFVYLPHCYQVNDNTQPISFRKMNKVDFGLPEDSFVFCSFNHPYKIDSMMFGVWMDILRQVSEGILWLLPRNKIAEENLKLEAEAKGIKSERLIYADKLPKDEHLARLGLADIVLDTRIYNGHTTTSDALWAGVPVITMQGSHFASRVSSSILTAIGLPDLITHSQGEYKTLTIELANNPTKLQEIRQRIAKNRMVAPLFDTPRFVKNLETAYKEMWNIFLEAETPRQIEVVES